MTFKGKEVPILLGLVMIGLLLGYLYFFSGLLDDSTSVTAKKEVRGNGLDNFITEVPMAQVEELPDDKLEAIEGKIDEELQSERDKKELDNTRQGLSRNGRANKMNDLTAIMEKDQKVTQQDQPSSQLKEPVIKKQSVPVKKSMQPVSNKSNFKEETDEQVVKKEIVPVKRRRSSDPSFEDSETKSVVATKRSEAEGIIHGEQSVNQGSRVKVRITQELEVETGPNEHCTIEVNTMLSGIVNMQQQRLTIEILTQCNQNDIRLIVYDPLDDREGLYVQSLNDNQEVTKLVVQDVVGAASRKMGVPMLDRAVRTGSNKKLNSQDVQLQSGKKLIIRQVVKEQ